MGFGGGAITRSIFLMALVLQFATDLRAQATATLRGEVTDPTGAVIQAATVTATNAAGKNTVVKTGRTGTFEIRGLEAGKYTISVNAKGFAVSSNDVELAAGKDQKLDVRLEIAVEKQQVVVDEDKPKVDLRPENNASATVIKGKDLEALSDDPDQLSNELQALAGPAAGPNGGEIYVDGFTGTQLPPKASIREVRVHQNPFSAQYDHLGYGRIEIFTKPGTDKFHGQFSFIENSSALNARNPFGGTHQPAYDSQEFVGSVGGPISKKASFFFSVGRHDVRDTSIINATVLDSNFNPIVLSEAVANPKITTDMSPRIDYQITPNNALTANLYLRYNQERNDGLGQFSLPSQGYDISNPGGNLQVTDTQIVSPRTVNETRFLYARDIHLEISQNFQPQVSVPGAFTAGGNTMGRHRAGINHLTQLYNLTSMTLGNHLVRFGGRMRTTNEAEISTQNFNGTFIFPSLQAYQITEQGLHQPQLLTPAQIRANGGGASQFSITVGKPESSATFVDAGIYGEDDWKILPNVMFSYGLRFESQDFIHANADLAPRLGVAWAPGGGKNASPKTVLRAGFGIFYDRFFQNFAIMADRLNGINQQQYIVAADSTSGPDFSPNVPPINTLTATQFPTVRQLDSRIRSPYVMQEATSFERQLSKTANLAVTYVHTRGVHQFLSRNINAPLPGTYDPNNKASGIRPFGNVGNIYQFQSDGIFKQNQLVTNFNVRGKVLSLFGFYMLNFANGDAGGLSGFPSNQYDLAADYGRTPWGLHHRLFFGGNINLPYQFNINPFVIINSGQPFNITLGEDLNGDSIFNDRPAFATPATSPANTVVTRWGAFDLNPAANEKRIPMNLGTGNTLYLLNLRLSKTFGLGGKLAAAQSSGGSNGGGGGEQRYNLTFSISARNLFNHENLSPPTGDLSSPRFGQSNGLAGGPFYTGAANRRVDLQVRFSF